MNIFILDEKPQIAAEYHCDKHVVKMILESAQMLSTTHWLQALQIFNKNISDFKRVRDAKEFLHVNLQENMKPPYKMTHVRHPCTIWTTESIENYNWHVKLLFYLCCEYTKRYGKQHLTISTLLYVCSCMIRYILRGLSILSPDGISSVAQL